MRTMLAVAVVMTAAPVLAQGEESSGLVAIVGQHGRCERLIVLGRDVTRNCGTSVLNTNYTDSRSGFTLPTTDGAVLTPPSILGLAARR